MESNLFLLAVVFSFALASCQAAPAGSSLVWQARQDAFSLAPSMTGTSQNLFNATARDITASNPSSFFFARIVGMYPSVNGAISSREQTSLLWAWGESHNSNYTVTGGAHNPDCPAPQTTLKETGRDQSFVFHFILTNGASSIEKTVSSDGHGNPLAIPFSQAELDSIQPSKSNSALPWIETLLNATITYHYKVSQYYYDYQCTYFTSASGAASKGCGCVPVYKVYNSDFTFTDNDSMNSTVETGTPEFALARPAGFEQSAGARQLLAVLFSNRNVSFAQASIDGQHANLSLAGYYKQAIGASAWASYSNTIGNLSSDSGAFSFSQNKSAAFGNFSAIVNSSGTYAYAYAYSIQTGNLGLGKHALVVSVSDMFGENDTYETYFYEKAGASVSLSCNSGALVANLTGASGLPIQGGIVQISYPRYSASCTTGTDGSCSLPAGNGYSGTASASFNGSQEYFGSYASCNASQAGPESLAYGLVAAFLLFGAILWAVKKRPE